MKGTTITFHDFNYEISDAICAQMGIDPKYFRKYHEITEGDYRDLWHEWMEYFDDDVNNGHITNTFFEIEDIDYVLERIQEDGKEWLEPFIRAVYAVFAENNIEYIRYYW